MGKPAILAIKVLSDTRKAKKGLQETERHRPPYGCLGKQLSPGPGRPLRRRALAPPLSPESNRPLTWSNLAR